MRDIYVGRQPIFDREQRVYGYELLYRDGLRAGPPADGERATGDVLLATFVELGLARVVGPHRAFLNFTRGFFVDRPPLPFDSARVVLEVLEDVPIDDRLIESIAALREAGFTIALDDYDFDPARDPLLPLVQIVKVEVPAVTLDRLPAALARLRRHDLLLLAEKVETVEEYRALFEMGFDLFQGYHFARPSLIAGRRLDESRTAVVQLIARLNDPQIEIDEIERLISRDAGLSYKVLRYINSAAIGLPRKVDSIRQAIVYVGLQRIRAWVTLVALTGFDGKPRELMNQALLRAHFCEQVALRSRCCDPSLAFTVGILSTLDLLLDRPLPDVLGELPLQQELVDALLDGRDAPGRALACIKAYESGQLDRVGFPGLGPGEIRELYLASSEQAFGDLAAVVDP